MQSQRFYTEGGVSLALPLPATVNASEEECSNICSFDGLDQLGVLGYETDWLWYDVLALCALILIFQTLAYVFLRLVKKQT